MIDMTKLVESVRDTIRNILRNKDLTEEEKDAKIEETVNNALWMVKLIGFSREEDED